ncbi:EF-hand domain-containing protein [Sphingomonas sp. MS122]|uniref:EF-hand domain-containing protein n=1 Tax=Sphingomonas sp. MS122 TaxID=3412683 RepID=UPI003C2EB735
MKNLLTATAIGTMLAAGVAIATQTEPPMAPRQPMSKAQMLERADARFDRMDANKDGQLSAEERKAGVDAARAAMAERKGGEMADFMPGARRGGAMADRAMERADTNGDGMISKAENRAAVEARFARMDANGDGTIGADERRMGRGMGMGKRARAQAAAGETMGAPGAMKAGHVMKRADGDGDGAISKAEFDAQSAERFAKLDANGDGKIDSTEMQAQRGKKRGAGGTTAPSPATPQDE